MAKRAVITGATKGIGLAIAIALADEGYDLAICSRHEAALKSLKAELTESHPEIEILFKATDVSDKSALQAFASLVTAHWNSLDVLVNNAGVFIPGKIIEEEDGQLTRMINTNLMSAYHLTRWLLPLMLPYNSGHVFNMCSIASQIAYPNGGSYSISKFALLGFSKVLREELKTSGIRVTSVLPGATLTASWDGVDLPADRFIAASDIAEAVTSALHMSASAVVEEIIVRPQLGDI